MRPSGPRAAASCRRLRGQNRGSVSLAPPLQEVYLPSTAAGVKHRIGASRSVNLALNLALALNTDGSYANQPFDESCVCQGFATFRPCFPGFKAGGECQTGASCRPSLSSTTTATS